ncbi:hypothetical protein V6N12_013125 [Hibiscus sabdariffa]|uniref:Gingipain domain-containing protein n=1 Tax=Hibiscus sabdariffa TaxID=183260 RepID=A0ABR2A9V6_9ROSI
MHPKSKYLGSNPKLVWLGCCELGQHACLAPEQEWQMGQPLALGVVVGHPDDWSGPADHFHWPNGGAVSMNWFGLENTRDGGFLVMMKKPKS